MNFPRIDKALADCKLHLTSTNKYGTEIEHYLVNYVLAIVYAEYEKQIREIIKKRGAQGVHAHVAAYISSAVEKTTRSIKFTDLSGFLAQFDPSCKEAFQAATDDQQLAAWDTLLKNRHELSHGSGSQLTMAEVQGFYGQTSQVLVEFETAIWSGYITG